MPAVGVEQAAVPAADVGAAMMPAVGVEQAGGASDGARDQPERVAMKRPATKVLRVEITPAPFQCDEQTICNVMIDFCTASVEFASAPSNLVSPLNKTYAALE